MPDNNHQSATEWFDAHATHVRLEDRGPSPATLALHAVAVLAAMGSICALVYVGVQVLADWHP